MNQNPNWGGSFAYAGPSQGYVSDRNVRYGSAPAPPPAADLALDQDSRVYTYVAPAYASLAAPRYECPDDETMPWDEQTWVPTTKSGKQKTPNMIRNELQRYIDSCKANGSLNQTRIIERMGVNNNSFRKFMDPGTYKNQWSATQNGTYWAAAKLLAQESYDKELAKASGAGKRKAPASGGPAKRARVAAEDDTPRKKTSTEKKLEALELVQRIKDVRGVAEGVVFDSCPQVVSKVKVFLQRDGMLKSYLLAALGNINGGSMNKFLSGKKQDQAGNVAYRTAYVFFEKLRILEGRAKTVSRSRNELEHPHGFSLEKERPGKYFKWAPAFGMGHPGW